MFDEVLKFGSMIVDALVAYKQPLFVYIPPFSELRGGAWVVVDSTINADCMEFYAAEDARGGVLEATGAVAIKFREKDLKSAAHRLDPELISLDAKLATLKAAETQSAAEITELSRQIILRERMLLGVYQQVAVHFGDLHDTPGRMKRKGVIRRQVNWVESRSYFFWRLQRRLAEFDISKKVEAMKTSNNADTDRTSNHANLATAAMIKDWFVESGGPESSWDNDDRMAVQWLKDNNSIITTKMAALNKAASIDSLAQNLLQILKVGSDGNENGSDIIAEILRGAMEKIGAENINAVMTGLREVL